jgi:hypothetical protein
VSDADRVCEPAKGGLMGLPIERVPFPSSFLPEQIARERERVREEWRATIRKSAAGTITDSRRLISVPVALIRWARSGS